MLVDLLERHAARTPAKAALVAAGTVLTYAQLRDTARCLAAALRDQGVEPGARLAVLAENRPEFLVLVAAAAYAGCTLAPVNVRLHPHEQQALVADCAPEVVFAEDGQAASRVAGRGAVVELGSHEWHRLIQRGRRLQVPSTPAPPALMLYATGGTSGLPKWCLISERNLAAQTRNFEDAIGLSASDRYGMLMPFFHIASGGMAIAVLLAGATGVLLPRHDPQALMQVLAAEAVTRTNLPAVVLRDLHLHGQLRRLSELQWLGTGNGTSLALQQAISREVCPNVWGWYGQTEATNITCAPRSTAQAQSGFGCIGRPALGARVRIVDEHGRDAPEGAIGELWTAGAHVMQGYWRRPEETSAALIDGWLRSGDLVRRGPDGSLFLVDRLKDIIKSGGETICSRELEVVLESHPAIEEAAVIGMPHPRWGETPRAVVVLKPGSDLCERDVVDHCRSQLASFKRPTSVVFAPKLPRNVAGKIRKDLLRREWSAPVHEGTLET